MTASVQGNQSKTHKMLKMNVFLLLYGLEKTVREFSEFVAFNKETNGQTDIKHVKDNKIN